MFYVMKDNKIKMQTSSKDCLYDEQTIKAMKKSGYKIIEKKEGK